ncbi:MAG: FKBP-type peptidyl-prolyl cis-trans isomerase [Bacteroidaceae bacterium]|nr:FKBP-type peptidyl-prolyl cis-trans isomerase [Bacteroidaceae bacterium]
MKHIFLLTLAFLTCIGVDAQNTRKKDKKQPKKEIVNTVKPVAADSLSYAIGLLQAESLVQYLTQREAIDTAHLDVALSALNCNLPTEEVNRLIAFVAGLKIQKMNVEMQGNLNRDFTGKADTAFIQLPLMNQGLTDAALGRSGMLTMQQANDIVKRQELFIGENLRIEGQQFLEKNKDAEGVVTRPSGLQYKVLTAGKGAVATENSMVEVHYEGRLLDGTVFDSSYKRGQTASFKPSQVIKGWKEALTLMPEGSTYELYIPYDLGYGEAGTRGIPPYSTLIFKVQVIKVK